MVSQVLAKHSALKGFDVVRFRRHGNLEIVPVLNADTSGRSCSARALAADNTHLMSEVKFICAPTGADYSAADDGETAARGN